MQRKGIEKCYLYFESMSVCNDNVQVNKRIYKFFSKENKVYSKEECE